LIFDDPALIFDDRAVIFDDPVRSFADVPVISTKDHSFLEYPPTISFFAKRANRHALTICYNAQSDYAGRKVAAIVTNRLVEECKMDFF